MLDFVESLESRRLLSAVSLASVEAALASDVGTLATDAKASKVALVDAAKTFASDFQALHLKNGASKSALRSAVGAARSKIEADVAHIIKAGFKDGQAIVTDVLHITIFNAGNPAKNAQYQKRLAAGIETLRALETPLVAKLTVDVANAQAQIGGAVQAVIAASGSESLGADWTALSIAFQSAQTKLTPDLNNVLSDVAALGTVT